MGLAEVFRVREGPRDDAEHGDAMDRTGYWGWAGAGCLFYARDTGRLLLAKRSTDVNEPGTWGTWGGAIDRGERPEDAVRREAGEEAGSDVGELIPVWTFQDPSGFRYHNFLCVVPHEFEPRLTWETDGSEWVRPGDWPTPLHPGLKALVKRRELLDLLRQLRSQR